jgi:chromosomal replication initiator protein
VPIALTPDTAWLQVREAIQANVSDQTFRTWFAPLRAHGFDGTTLTLEVPNPFFVEWLDEHHRDTFARASQNTLGDSIGVGFAVSTTYAPEAFGEPVTAADLDTPADRSRKLSTAPLRVGEGGPFELNPRFSFDSFVVGKSNEFGTAVCTAVSKNPGREYNPLFIYGGVGLGKTHLMQAIGNHVSTNKPTATVRYVTAERFMNELIQSIRQSTTFEFKKRYRTADLLLIDDIQFLAGKESTQEEFFHTFNALYDDHKQIVITADRSPSDLRGLEERLVSRFNWGLVTDINPPDFETRVAILRRKAEADSLNIGDDVILLIAEQVTDNVRELEGSLIRLSALASLTNSTITVDLAREHLKDLVKSRSAPRVNAQTIMRHVAKEYEANIDDMKGKRRTSAIAFPRQVAMFLCKEMTGQPFMEIGKTFGGRDHTTVLYACDKIRKQMAADEAFRRRVDEIAERVKRGDDPNVFN